MCLMPGKLRSSLICLFFSIGLKFAEQMDFLCREKTRIKLFSIVFYNKACKHRKAIMPAGESIKGEDIWFRIG